MKRELLQILGEENVKFLEPLKNHCTFRIGGEAGVFATPTNFTDLFELLRIAKSYGKSCKIIGNASNLLFNDTGYDGVVVCTKKINSFCKVDSTRIIASAGMMLSQLQKVAMQEGLAGLEFASGIPATVGGAICMNAGAFGGEISNLLRSVTFFDNGKVITKKASEIFFGYRNSEFLKTEKIILFAEFEFEKGNSASILAKANEYLKVRANTQPKGFSAGSVFKRAENISAGKLIDEAGLKGKKENGAMVSDIHANFIINFDNASQKDVMTLINQIQATVYEVYGVTLEPEIEFV